MLDTLNRDVPASVRELERATDAVGFELRSDPLTGVLLRTLAASKPHGRVLELGTGTGLSTAWILDGMDREARLLTVEIDPELAAIARRALDDDPRVDFHIGDARPVLKKLEAAGRRFDMIFADSGPGKFSMLAAALDLLAEGGLYVIDDMLLQAIWEEERIRQVVDLLRALQRRNSLVTTKLNWGSGIVIAVRRSSGQQHDMSRAHART